MACLERRRLGRHSFLQCPLYEMYRVRRQVGDPYLSPRRNLSYRLAMSISGNTDGKFPIFSVRGVYPQATMIVSLKPQH